MDFDALYHANFKLLDDAVTDWGDLVDNLQTLKTRAEDGLHQAANKADWSGLNSQVTKQFIGKTAGEFADAHTQATTVHHILRDTRGELKKYKGQLEDAVERGRKQNITVIGYEGGFTVTSNVPPEGRAHTDKDNQHDITALRDEIEKILKNATESDSSANEVLKAIADQTELGFSDATYKDRDDAAAAIKEAEDLAKLAKKDPGDLSPREFDQLAAGLKKYRDDPLFAERFATTLGPKKTLEFWAGISDPGVASPELTHDRYKQFGELQKSLSMTLATASQSDTQAMAEWKRNVINLGDQPIGPRGAYGFQIMSNLMRAGDYDDSFMTAYGKRLMETEREFSGDGKHGAWQRMNTNPYYNRMGGDSGYDPLSGFMKGLSNSPDAATEFFNDDFIAKDDDHKHAVSNFKYLFEQRDWPDEVKSDLSGESSDDGRNNLAKALEAATTGHPAGELPTLDTPAHNADQAKLFSAIVSSVGNSPELLTEHGFMSNSMGQIASEYLPDINRAATDVKSDADAWRDVKNLYPISGSAAHLEHPDVTKFLFAVGQNEHGYAAVEVGQKSYMGKLMEYHLDPDLPSSERYSQDDRTVIERISKSTGEISGVLGIGRQEGIGGPAAAEDEDYEKSVAQYKNLASGTAATVTGAGTSIIASPMAGAVVGGVLGTATGAVMESVFADASGHQLDAAQGQMGSSWQTGYVDTGERTGQAARLAAAANPDVDDSDADSWARDAARQGYINARPLIEGQAPGSITTSS
ncbi:hypothetical protein ACIBL6_06830 [Streptomyces sp. NPDC050400]|uniref:hypothetical protein n=1 Tax=Streptomyces sp. NPDC050400 TaxID=3365610 RepID=UPI0037AA83D0